MTTITLEDLRHPAAELHDLALEFATKAAAIERDFGPLIYAALRAAQVPASAPVPSPLPVVSVLPHSPASPPTKRSAEIMARVREEIRLHPWRTTRELAKTLGSTPSELRTALLRLRGLTGRWQPLGTPAEVQTVGERAEMRFALVGVPLPDAAKRTR